MEGLVGPPRGILFALVVNWGMEDDNKIAHKLSTLRGKEGLREIGGA